MDKDTIVPHCGYPNPKIASYKPWDATNLEFSFPHFLKHVAIATRQFLLMNQVFMFILSVFVVIVGMFTYWGPVTTTQYLFSLALVISLLLGFIIRMTKKDLRKESLQVWFRDAYGLMVPYDEIAITLIHLDNGEKSYEMSNGGSLVRISNGVVYEPPLQGSSNHEPIENPA
jgi:hypothetical protein